jgi:hypothetical protein
MAFRLDAQDEARYRSETRKKDRASRRFAVQFKAWGLTLADEVLENLSFSGEVSTGLQDRLWGIMYEHYVESMDDILKFDFAEYTRTGVIDESDETVRDALESIASALVTDIMITGRETHKQILKTTTKNILQSIELARDTFKAYDRDYITKQEPPPAEPVPTAEEVMSIARRLLIMRLNMRADLIGITEAQWAMEGARFKTIDTGTNVLNALLRGAHQDMLNGRPDLAMRKLDSAAKMAKKSFSTFAEAELAKAKADVKAGKIRKEARQVISFKAWVTRMDDRVRATHILALGQRVRNDEPFTVGNSKLMYPGDRSLNADKAETVKCRCWVIYN